MIKQLLQLYFIMGSNNVLPNQSPLAVLEAALQTGITCFQFREKGTGSLHGKEKTIFAKACQQLCQQYNVPFIVNDDIDLALALQADGVHVGQDDADAAWVRKQLGDKKIIGVSAHTTEEVVTAIENGADYVGMGPVYPTTTKKDAQAVMGTSLIKQTREQFPDLPIVAIGGITLENYAPILQAGADGISIISAIAQSTDPAQTTSLFAKGIREIIG